MHMCFSVCTPCIGIRRRGSRAVVVIFCFRIIICAERSIIDLICLTIAAIDSIGLCLAISAGPIPIDRATPNVYVPLLPCLFSAFLCGAAMVLLSLVCHQPSFRRWTHGQGYAFYPHTRTLASCLQIASNFPLSHWNRSWIVRNSG